MAHVLIMPRQGNTVESCIIVRWQAAEGDRVQSDQTVCEVETDKASFDVPAGAEGLLLKILRPEGDDVPVLEPIAVIGAAGEDWRAALGKDASAAAPALGADPGPKAAPRASIAPAAQAPVAESLQGARGVSPRARRDAAGAGLDPSTLEGSGPGGRVIERDIAAAIAARPSLTAAARAAMAPGAAAPQSGGALGGRVGLADLAAARAAPTAAVPIAAAAPAAAGVAAAVPVAAGAAAVPAGVGAFTDTPIKGIRKLIGERMMASLASSAQLTFNLRAGADHIASLRSRFKASDPSLGFAEVTIGDLVLYAVSRVLPTFPDANAHLESGVLRRFERVHLGLAVDTARGLMVPVIRNADLLSLVQISAEAKRLAAACQGGSISPDELGGSTFTVSNLGAFGIESFTPVLNVPEVAILGVCAITRGFEPGADGEPEMAQRMGLSLTVDHRVIDGAPAARILKAIADAIADIDLLLLK